MLLRSPTVGKLPILAALCLGAVGCTSFSEYEPTARTPEAPVTPGNRVPATSATRPDGAVVIPPGGEAPQPVGTRRDPRSTQPTARQEIPASAVLIEQSRDERASGSYAEAAATIERALRIDPNNPALWIELAEIKAAERDYDQAEMMARKALTLAGSDRSIMARAERLLD